jgi:hypothetical protein
MGCDVYANGDEIACKAGAGKVIAAFPDVCLSPPSPPAGPVPVPYPDTSFSKDMQSGTKTVMIKDQEVMMKDSSFYATSPLGDEAATKSLGAGVVTHVITGKTYFVAWSMDVQFEGANVDRNLDLTTSNHASPGGNSAPQNNISAHAQQLLNQGKCPCCKQKSPACAAAPKDDDPPGSNRAMTFREYYGLDETDNRGRLTDRARTRQAQLETWSSRKRKKCTCEGEVFPQQPCNVFRPKNTDRKNAIETQWDEEGRKEAYADRYRAANPPGTPKSISEFVRRNPSEPAPPEKGAFKQVNHLVPKQAGGCTVNDANLEPDDLLCKVCKKIDDEFGEFGWQ